MPHTLLAVGYREIIFEYPQATAVVDLDSWTIPPVFRLLQEAGNLTQDDMLSTFNCGVGMVVIVREEHAASVCETTGGFIMGHISAGERDVVCQ